MKNQKSNFIVNEYRYIVYLQGQTIADSEPIGRFKDKETAQTYCDCIVGNRSGVRSSRFFVYNGLQGKKEE